MTAMLGPQAHLLARYMDLLSARQRVTAMNVANADTPGYLTQEIDFGWELAKALDDPGAAAGAPVSVRPVGGREVKNDGNDVSIDRELQVLADTAIRFDLASVLLKGGIGTIRSAIHEGRGPGG